MDNDTEQDKEIHSIPIEWGDYTSMKEQFHLYIVKKADRKVINTKGKRNITEIGRLIDMNRGTVRKYLKLAGIL